MIPINPIYLPLCNFVHLQHIYELKISEKTMSYLPLRIYQKAYQIQAKTDKDK